jgi:hypothetical protein
VRKLIAIFFLCLFSVSTTEAGQLIKIPKLVAHFAEYKKQDGGSFFNFLDKHYFDNHPDDGDEKEDAELPFKVINADCFSCIYVAANNIDVSDQFTSDFISHPLYISPFIDNKGLLGIFRPPRHC